MTFDEAIERFKDDEEMSTWLKERKQEYDDTVALVEKANKDIENKNKDLEEAKKSIEREKERSELMKRLNDNFAQQEAKKKEEEEKQQAERIQNFIKKL